MAVTYLEVLRFQHNGGCLNSNQQDGSYRSALMCLFEYVETPDLVPAVYQCLTTIVQRAFSAALIQLVPHKHVIQAGTILVCVLLFRLLDAYNNTHVSCSTSKNDYERC